MTWIGDLTLNVWSDNSLTEVVGVNQTVFFRLQSEEAITFRLYAEMLKLEMILWSVNCIRKYGKIVIPNFVMVITYL